MVQALEHLMQGYGSGIRIQGSGFKVQGLRYRFKGVGFMV